MSPGPAVGVRRGCTRGREGGVVGGGRRGDGVGGEVRIQWGWEGGGVLGGF